MVSGPSNEYTADDAGQILGWQVQGAYVPCGTIDTTRLPDLWPPKKWPYGKSITKMQMPLPVALTGSQPSILATAIPDYDLLTHAAAAILDDQP